jgi:DNA-binding CsgD family transcriptional regulator
MQSRFALVFGDQRPAARLNHGQVRRLLALGVSLRWASAALAALAGLLTGPRPFGALVGLIITVAIYNGCLALAIRQADEAGARRLARVSMILDQFFAFAAVAIFAGQPQGAAPYIFVTLEAVAYEGAVGGLLSMTAFAFLEIGFQVARQAFFHVGFAVNEVIVFTSVVGLAGAAFIAVTNILSSPQQEIDGASLSPAFQNDGEQPVHLTRREREIIQLMASGYSNGMIASHLHLSESTVKGYVEMLLNRLNVRNRTEAVARASRMKLL